MSYVFSTLGVECAPVAGPSGVATQGRTPVDLTMEALVLEIIDHTYNVDDPYFDAFIDVRDPANDHQYRVHYNDIGIDLRRRSAPNFETEIIQSLPWSSPARYFRLHVDGGALMLDTSEDLVEWTPVAIEPDPLIPLDAVFVTLGVEADSLTNYGYTTWGHVIDP
jgi:hypothetical protein